MGIFSRISDIFKSNVNDALDNAEDPEKMIKLMVIEMQESVNKATSGLATAMAQEKKLERDLDKYKLMSEDFKSKATQAMQAGNEDLARKALAKKAEADQQAQQYQAMFDSASAMTTKLKEQVDGLKAKLSEARLKESTLIARSQTAKAQTDIAKQIGGFDSNSFAKFDKFEEKILKSESEAQAFTELSDSNKSIDDDFKLLTKNSQVDEEFEKLKASLNAKPKDSLNK